MKRACTGGLLAMLIALPSLACASGVTALPAAPAPVPIVLPHPPPVTNATSGALASAVLHIWQAQRVDPQAAQNASFAYVGALQQYRAGNLAGANAGVRRALAIAGAAQVVPINPVPLVTPAEPSRSQLPGLEGGLYGADAPAIDADTFVALARGTVAACAARHDRRVTSARTFEAKAEADFAARNWQATRTDAKAAIDACPQINQ